MRIPEQFQTWANETEFARFLDLFEDIHLRRATKMFVENAFKKGFDAGLLNGKEQLANVLEEVVKNAIRTN